MKAAQLERIANNNFQLNTPTRVPYLRTIVFETRYSCDPVRDLITFDTSDMLAKIKHYSGEVVSGKLTNDFSVNGSELKSRYIIYKDNGIYRFRAPREGDILAYVNPSNGQLVNPLYTVVYATLNRIVVDKDFEKSNHPDYVLVYIDSKKLGVCSSSPTDNTIFLKYEPISSNTYDTYIDINKIVAFDFVSPRMGA